VLVETVFLLLILENINFMPVVAGLAPKLEAKAVAGPGEQRQQRIPQVPLARQTQAVVEAVVDIYRMILTLGMAAVTAAQG
jgi:hypothetical protein